MDPEVEKIIKAQMEKLPIKAKKLFADSALGDKILNIGKKNGLNTEQLAILQMETYLVILGLVHLDEYQNELKNRLNVNNLKTDNLVNDINREILNGCIEKLKEMYEKEGAEPNWQQNLDFVLSGGDYSVFLEKRDDIINTTPQTPLVRGDAIPPRLDKGEAGRGF